MKLESAERFLPQGQRREACQVTDMTSVTFEGLYVEALERRQAVRVCSISRSDLVPLTQFLLLRTRFPKLSVRGEERRKKK